MKKSDERFIKNWEKTRALGFKKYVLTHGLGFGILITIVNLLWLQFGGNQELSTEDFFTTAILMIVVGGLTYAGLTWLMNEYMYKRKVNQKD